MTPTTVCGGWSEPLGREIFVWKRKSNDLEQSANHWHTPSPEACWRQKVEGGGLFTVSASQSPPQQFWRRPPSFVGLFKSNHHLEWGLFYLYLWIVKTFLSLSKTSWISMAWIFGALQYSCCTSILHELLKKVRVPAEGTDHSGFSHPGMVTLMCNQSTGKVCLLQRNFKRSLA